MAYVKLLLTEEEVRTVLTALRKGAAQDKILAQYLEHRLEGERAGLSVPPTLDRDVEQ